jgi:hypothetical protein
MSYTTLNQSTIILTLIVVDTRPRSYDPERTSDAANLCTFRTNIIDKRAS